MQLHQTSKGLRPHRDVVSFVRRGERLSTEQQQAWDALAEQYVLDPPRAHRDTLPAAGETLDVPALFGRTAPLVVEVGSGQGENLVAAALAHPERDFLGVEVYAPGLAQTLVRLQEAAGQDGADLPQNLRMLPLDAQRALPQMLPSASIDELWVYFADPWPKQRHHKRRLINPPFLDAVLPLLREGAAFRLATDWAQYAHHMRFQLDARPELELLFPQGPRPDGDSTDAVPETMAMTGWAPRFAGRVKTGFEAKGRRAGRLIWDLAYTRVAEPGTDDGTAGEGSA
ncbi:tRNA (guanosine(46)-N7)-methyltransferase TrmB [Brachybacterium sp. UMB0905]|uniref:tRNA (guanosine(46)-N7)-methyltransferase TrmB n=1 Tax=Brachybacterium sp. UMB0905 TaxID=2069310 RepID=UPI001E516251|nr:tRNA (guanosine(46)-N7)-methyltransferase TrmB [Brachybacterium sp. UMB0905]